MCGFTRRTAASRAPVCKDPLVRNPTVRAHPPGVVVAAALLVACSVVGGMWGAAAYDAIRVSIVDMSLAYELGHLGELTDASGDPMPRGLDRDTLLVMAIAGFITWMIAYAATVASRRRIGDPNAISFTLGIAFPAAAVGFFWLAGDWPQAGQGDWNAAERLIQHGDVWVPLLMLAAGFLLLRWWSRSEPAPDKVDDDA